MKDIETTARILASLTEEQWEAILTVSPHLASNIPEGVFLKENQTRESEEKDLNFKIREVLKKIGVPPHILGYNYLQEAIIMVCEDESCIHKVTKVIYPEIAKKFGTTIGKIGRSIQHAIEKAFDLGDPAVHQEVFKGIYFPLKGKPTNSHAIAAIAEYVTLYS